MKILLLDIETAPHRVYSWGLFRQNIAINQIEEPGYTLCWSAKWYGAEEVMFSSIYKDGWDDMIEKIYKLLDEADVVVHYNGTKFDIPTLNQEFISAGYSPPSPVLQIDLLSTARRRFRLASNKLDYVAGFLGLRGKVKHKGMELWRDCMAGDAEAWEIMEKYNRRDTVLLEEVYNRLRPWILNHPNHGLFKEDDSEDFVCPNCGSTHLQKRGRYYTKTLSYQRYRCMSCKSWHRERTTDLPLDKRHKILVGVM